jgi:hypothetical protein
MKKWIVTIAIVSLFQFGHALDVEEHKDYFQVTLLFDHVRAVKLINKIQSNTSKSKEKILKTMLEIELEELEEKLNMYLDSLDSVKDEYQGREHSYLEEVEIRKAALNIIAEWRKEYL